MNANTWRTATLGQLLRRNEQMIPIDPTGKYREVTVRLWGKGVVLRGVAPGSSMAADRRIQISANQFIISKIDARNGAMGLVPPELHGAVVSNDFPTFETDESFLLPEFLGWLSRTKPFVDECRRASEGTTNRVRLKEERFNAIEIRIPPVDEQRRIVDRIHYLADRAQEAAVAATSADLGHDRLVSSWAGAHFTSLAKSYSFINFGDLNPHISSGPRNWSRYYASAGVRFYRAQDIGSHGTVQDGNRQFVSPPDGKQGQSAFLKVGDLMIVITGATVGRVGLYTQHHEPGLVSQHVAICRLPTNRILPRFAWWGLRGPIGQEQLLGQRYGQGKPGLKLTNIQLLRLPLPPIDVQEATIYELDALEAKLTQAKNVRRARAAEIAALVPSILDRAFRRELQK
jgi:type I restriction enzyme S subunit